MEKKINYLARTFGDIKDEIIKFSKKYYPEISDTFNDASVGSWMIDLLAAVGDNLSYHTDRMYQENNIESANLKSSVMNLARTNGVKVVGPKASLCEVELSCILPLDGTDISKPKWDYAPIMKMGSIVGNGDYQFELTEDVDFSQQFNDDGVSNRKFSPQRNTNGVITSYTVTKTAIVMGGTNKVYKKTISQSELEPFMSFTLPEKNIMNVESIIFKESVGTSYEPKSYEFYVEEEEFKANGEDAMTYRFFEVDSLASQYMFATESSNDALTNGFVYPPLKNVESVEVPEVLEEGERPQYRFCKGQWKPISQKFITEYTDNGYLKVTFGGGTSLVNFNKDGSTNIPDEYAQYVMTKVMNNDSLGVLPHGGWTMFVLYRTGGGTSANLAQGAINTVVDAKIYFKYNFKQSEVQQRNAIAQSIKVTNPSPSIGGKDMPSVNEIKFLSKYSVGAQERCVTVKDYKSRISMIPPKYGCPFRWNAFEDNNKIIIPTLWLDSDGKLSINLPQIIRENMVEYLKGYKMLTDYVEITNGKIFNLLFQIDVFVDKNYVVSEVIRNVIETAYDYMSVTNRDMGEEIFIGDLEREINNTDGVLGLIDLRIYALYNGGYSVNVPSLPRVVENALCNNGETQSRPNVGEDVSWFRIDLNAIDSVLYNDVDSMFEIKNKNADIEVRAKVR